MRYDISKFEELVEQGFLRKSEKDDMVLYGYTDHCTFERHWNEYTRVARGLILNKHTGEVIAKPFPKFFNLGEMPETFLPNVLIEKNYETFEKVDGSLGIIFFHDGRWQIATRGSFYSEQAQKGAELLKKYNLDRAPIGMTILAEIIYPENKIIVDYGDQEKLVVLGGFDRNSGHEFSPSTMEDMAEFLGMEFAKRYSYTIEEMIALQKTMSKNEEGFVVRYSSGLRVKIKGDEYMKIAKMISSMSPISFWESMEGGVVNRTYLAQLPEDIRNEFEPIVDELEQQYSKIMSEIVQDVSNLPTTELTHEGRKRIGIFLRDTKEIKHPSAMFPYLTGGKDNLDKYILKQIRPTGNVMRDVV